VRYEKSAFLLRFFLQDYLEMGIFCPYLCVSTDKTNLITEMRKTSHSTIAMFLMAVIGLVFACATGGEQKSQEFETVAYENPMKFIGVLHNKGLAQIMNEVNSLTTTRAKTEFDVLTRVNKFVETEFSDLSKEDIGFVQDKLAQNFSAITCGGRAETNITEAFVSFVGHLDELMSDEDNDLVSLRSRIMELENEAEVVLSENELTIFLMSSAVAFYTLEYWRGYATTKITRAPFSWKELAKADVGGVVTGLAVVGAERLIMGRPVGWKVCAAAAVGGAVGGSAWNAIDQLW
jgi:hypothetical protein